MLVAQGAAAYHPCCEAMLAIPQHTQVVMGQRPTFARVAVADADMCSAVGEVRLFNTAVPTPLPMRRPQRHDSRATPDARASKGQSAAADASDPLEPRHYLCEHASVALLIVGRDWMLASGHDRRR
jgi:hypothetical protein